MFSHAVALSVSALYLGAAQIDPQTYSQFLVAMQTAFMTLAALCLLGIFFSMARGKTRPRENKPKG